MYKEKFNIIDCGRYITIVNIRGEYQNHCHINKGHKKKQYNTANMLVRLIRQKRVPRSKYLRKCALRLSLDKKYKDNIRIKIAKDKDRIYYHNPQKGVVR